MKMLLFVSLTILFLFNSVLPQEKSYSDLSLDDCIAIAKENSKQKQIAETKIDISKSHLRQAESGLWPSLELTSKAFIQDEPQNFIFPSTAFDVPTIDMGQLTIQIPPVRIPAQDIKLLDTKSVLSELTLVYPIFTGGKVSSIIDQVELSILMAKNNLILTESDLVLNVKNTYYAVILTKQLLQIGTDAFERFEATYNLTESLYKTGSGTVTKIDYLKNKMTLELFRGIVSDLKSKQKIAESGLKYYLGIDLDSDISIKDINLEFEFSSPNENDELNNLLSSNMYLKNLDIATNIYEARIDEAKSDYYPSLALFGNYQRLDNNYDAGYATKSNKNVFTVGLGLKLSIFNGFRTAGKVDENEAELKGLKLQKVYVEEGLKMKLNQLITEINKSEETIKSSKEAMIAGIENRDLNQRAYQNDIGPVKDFIEAQIFESLMMGQYQLALYERAELKAKLDFLLGSTD